MATTNGGYTTGAGRDEAELRRRNVTGYETANGGQVVRLEAEDTKKLQKVNKLCPIDARVVTDILVQPKVNFLQILDDYEFLIAPLIFTAFALFTRLWKIGLSPIVTWDEAQYGNGLKSSQKC